MAGEYRYQPLPPRAEYGRSPPFTRNLRLTPGRGDDQPLIATLELTDVSNTALYEALSGYLWLGDWLLPIKPNLVAALRALRLPDLHRRLWVDATPGVEQASAAASRLSQAVATLEHTGDEAARDGAVVRGGYAGMDAEAVDAFIQSMLNDVHPAAMEVVAAPWAIVRVEELEISFTERMSIALFVVEWRQRIAIDKPLALWHSIYLSRGPSDSGPAIRTLRRAVSSFHGFMQRHRPDQRFGTPKALRPDYRKDAVAVYTDTTRFLMRKQSRMLDVLAHVQHNADPSLGEYPSWVPKWFEPSSCFPIRGAFLAGLCDGHFRYFAELHDSLWRGQPQRPRVLSLDGFGVDVVDRFPMFAPDSPPYRNGEPLEVALCNALAVSPLGYITGSMMGNFAQGKWSNMAPVDAMQEGKGEGLITQRC
ncbi:hypothetical protein MMYC01_204524 [Madurella mycetomatis]|uniref:Uncharacterized protein n=1 Tax=Madurella mycetomatis TaxID=100816 RepID=A0A175W532_9PEZI|nr:hypothetical protein MMYC01_204524 [Madurella mycetomatis]